MSIGTDASQGLGLGSGKSTGNKLRRDAGIIGLLYAGVGGMIGSGWLFGPLNAAKQAGPLSIWSWVIGAVAVLFLAFVYAELATMFPRSGALVHISHISHGPLVGRIWSWILILAYVTIAPVEAMAIIGYANAYIPGLVDPVTSVLTAKGFWVAIAVLAVMVGFNFMVVGLVLKVNSIATWWKIAIPIGTVIVLIAYSYHPANLASAPPKNGIEGIFTAVATAGVFFSLFGFRQAIDLAGETSNPGKFLPIAIIGTVVIGAVIYIALQFAFLTAIEPKMLQNGGWAGLHFTNITGPFAALATLVGATWWGVILYADAIVSPGACGFIYTTTTSRIIMATGETRDMPGTVSRINGHGVPWVALIATFVIGAIFFFPFPSWQKLVGYISSITVLSYGIGPIVLLGLRIAAPKRERAFRLKGAWFVAPVAFIFSNMIILWAGFGTADFLFILLLVIFAIYAAYYFVVRRGSLEDFGWRTTWWLVPYFGGMWLLSALSPTGLGGDGTFSLIGAMIAVVVFSLAIMALALKTSMTDEKVRETAAEVAALTP